LTIEAPGREVIAVQMLRGIAATMVVFAHLNVQAPRLHYGKLGTNWMTAGVDVFFVISGFIMWISVERRPNITARAFLENRIIRIVPLYWLITTAVLLIGLCAPRLLNSTAVYPSHVVASYLFLPARHPVLTDKFWPLLIPGWSLNYEMLFYVIFALAIAIEGGSRVRRFTLIVVMLALVLIGANLMKASIDVMNFYANPVLLEFAVGMLLGVLWRSGMVKPSLIWLAVSAVGFVLLWLPNHVGGGFLATMTGASMVVGGAIFAPAFPPNPLAALGDASYSLYLTHSFTLATATLIWRELFWYLGRSLFVLFCLALAYSVAFLMYHFFEVPMTAALKSQLRSPTRSQSSSQ
jgi:exopolysaccharide production protein ExoZ